MPFRAAPNNLCLECGGPELLHQEDGACPSPAVIASAEQFRDIDWLSDEETRKLILSFADARGPEGSFTPAEAAVLVNWAREIRMQTKFLEMILEGIVQVDVRDGDVVFLNAK